MRTRTQLAAIRTSRGPRPQGCGACCIVCANMNCCMSASELLSCSCCVATTIAAPPAGPRRAQPVAQQPWLSAGYPSRVAGRLSESKLPRRTSRAGRGRTRVTRRRGRRGGGRGGDDGGDGRARGEGPLGDHLNTSSTGLAQFTRLGPAFWLIIHIRGLSLARDSGQPCAICVLCRRPTIKRDACRSTTVLQQAIPLQYVWRYRHHF